MMEQDMRVIVFGIHLSYLTGIEDFLQRKGIEFRSLSKSTPENYESHLVEEFEADFSIKVLLVDLLLPMTTSLPLINDTVAVFGEVLWQLSPLMESAITFCSPLKNAIFLFARHTIDE